MILRLFFTISFLLAAVGAAAQPRPWAPPTATTTSPTTARKAASENSQTLAGALYQPPQTQVEALLADGLFKLGLGDLSGALESFKAVQIIDPHNAQAQYYQNKITETLIKQGTHDHLKTRTQMLEEVSHSWQRPAVFDNNPCEDTLEDPATRAIAQKLRSIIIPKVSFCEMPLGRVIEHLSELSVEYDALQTEASATRGVNIVLIDPKGVNPKINLTLRDASLERILTWVAQSAHFEYELEPDTIVLRPSEGPVGVRLETAFYPISRATLIRLANIAEPNKSKGTLQEEEKALKSFFDRAGVSFEGPGRNFAFDGTQLIVTQTPRNLERMRNILRRYDETLQVEIEAKFMEVQQGALEQLGFEWRLSNGQKYFQTQNASGTETVLRNLAQSFATRSMTSGPGAIIVPPSPAIPIVNRPPMIPNNINLGIAAPPIANILGIIDGWQLQVMIDALEQQTGTDLMSAPKLTVLSGKTAEIVVAQELPYPQSYSKIESSVGMASSLVAGGSAGVTITAGTPQNFTTRLIGVQMEVTPTVERDHQSISLRLEPQVTEFEGFVEYGGQSIAISGGTTVNVPSGFFQPIFSVRKIRTEVTIYDGATVVMGGLTREEVKTVDDKVPVLGDIPLLGRLFQSKGESSQKRNLLIFVTANSIGPGGSPSKQILNGLKPSAIFQNPLLVTPVGDASREALTAEAATLSAAIQ